MQAEYIAFRNPLVRALSQFLYVDGGEPVTLTFQSGLNVPQRQGQAGAAGVPPARLDPARARRGEDADHGVRLARIAPNGTAPKVAFEFRRKGSAPLAHRRDALGEQGPGYVTARIRTPGTGELRLRYGAARPRAVDPRPLTEKALGRRARTTSSAAMRVPATLRCTPSEERTETSRLPMRIVGVQRPAGVSRWASGTMRTASRPAAAWATAACDGGGVDLARGSRGTGSESQRTSHRARRAQ